MPEVLPDRFADWFTARGWTPRPHQLDLLAIVRAGRSALLVAPTGAGKTLAGFLPSLTALAERPPAKKSRGLHTLYISPLKALAVDIARNLEAPIAEMGLSISVETRTGDTPSHKRTRQVERPPDILLTTPEQLALLIAHREASELFSNLSCVVLDELHALVTSKRGDLLSLALARLHRLSPGLTAIGLSATVREPDDLRRYLVPQRHASADERGSPTLSLQEREHGGADEAGVPEPPMADLVVVRGGAAPDLHMLDTGLTLPLAGHTAWQAMPAIYDLIGRHRTVLVFVNTRLQAEYTFQELWRINEESYPIALHHGSLDATQRRRVEAAMAAGQLRAIVCTATLDLGIDWGDVDLVVNIGAPKGASRIMQRIGRANHRMDEPSKAYLVPANRFEILECQAALDAVEAAAQDTPDARLGAPDVLAQHILGMACADAFDPLRLYDEIVSAAPYATLSWEDFEAVVDYVATGGYALRAYERFAKILRGPDGLWRVRDARTAQQYRMNVGTIVESAKVKVRLARANRARPGAVLPRGGRVLGEIEEDFADTLTPGDTFLFAGEVLRFEGLTEDEALATRAGPGTDPAIPSYAGAKFPISTFLAARVRAMIADPFEWDRLPKQVSDYLVQQRTRSVLPGPTGLLVETFPRSGRYYLTAFPFEGRLAHQTLGMLLTRRLERARMRPLGFAANDYGIAIWMTRDLSARIATESDFLEALFAEDMLGDDLEAWLDESAMMKRTFRQCAVIAGLIERRYPGQAKTGRQVTMSTDLVYDVLRKHQPDHLLLRAARQDAATGLLDVKRLGVMLRRIQGRIVHKALDRVSPLSVSVMLEIGREKVYGEGADEILAEAEAQLLEEALG
ncbi:DNA ligase-associated DEXH box helicase [Methylobacterium sp. Leaf102]|uniref:ligase-associated DNA damage response DEXH box helicase n=1 Tax=unclassified Methylobacterium TaxID=2615210 RepID=UPI0006FAF2E7|nr:MULTISPECIES: ligase-associated DNA damage response DEXH box helicase [unclassified Methylobacterium]KQP32799.1 DNA ligase-associated DEXH box helicase [Methylobacterium sp. Leaf102]KQP33499.1 DNA ligase-associated DEXH box helicase [Methylobacterium sp. Leaf100]